MKILIIGGSGLVGSHILREARARGHEVVGTCRTRRDGTDPALVIFDAAQDADTAPLLDRLRPDAVVHAAGWTWVDGCEDDPARAMDENTAQPARLAAACARRRRAVPIASSVTIATSPFR